MQIEGLALRGTGKLHALQPSSRHDLENGLEGRGRLVIRCGLIQDKAEIHGKAGTASSHGHNEGDGDGQIADVFTTSGPPDGGDEAAVSALGWWCCHRHSCTKGRPHRRPYLKSPELADQ